MKPARIIKMLTNGVNRTHGERINEVDAAIRATKMDEALAKEYPAVGLTSPEITVGIMGDLSIVHVILSVPMPCQHDCPTGVPARDGGYYTFAKADVAFPFAKLRDPIARVMEVTYHMAGGILKLKELEKELNGEQPAQADG